MNRYRLVYSPIGGPIGTVAAKNGRAAIRKAPKPYSKYKGEIYAELLDGKCCGREGTAGNHCLVCGNRIPAGA